MIARSLNSCLLPVSNAIARQPLSFGSYNQPPLEGFPLEKEHRSKYAAASGVSKGAYVLADTPGIPMSFLLRREERSVWPYRLTRNFFADGIRSRVVSMPSWDIFEHQTQEYRDSVLPPGVTARVAIEQASTFGWERYVGPTGRLIGMHTFGASAPLKELQKKFGFEPYEIVTAAKQQIGGRVA
jgi:transketolase